MNEIRFLIEAEVPFSANTFTEALHSTQPSIQWVLKLKRNKPEADHSPRFSACRYITSSLLHNFITWCLIKYRSMLLCRLISSDSQCMSLVLYMHFCEVRLFQILHINHEMNRLRLSKSPPTSNTHSFPFSFWSSLEQSYRYLVWNMCGLSKRVHDDHPFELAWKNHVRISGLQACSVIFTDVTLMNTR
jgi:hypothetical protein